MYPDGLANSSGQVGRNYMRHVTGSVYGEFEKPVNMYRGTTMAGIVQDEARHDPSRGFVGGYELETLSLGLPFMVHSCDPVHGERISPKTWKAMKIWPVCGLWVRICPVLPTALL